MKAIVLLLAMVALGGCGFFHYDCVKPIGPCVLEIGR